MKNRKDINTQKKGDRLRVLALLTALAFMLSLFPTTTAVFADSANGWEAEFGVGPTSQANPDATPAAQTNPDATLAAQVTPDATLAAQVAPDATLAAQVAPDATLAAQVAPDAVPVVQVAPDGAQLAQAEPDGALTLQAESGAALTSQVESSGAASITLSYRADDSGFVIAPAVIEIEPGLARQYGYADEYGGLEPTALDAIVVAHIAVFGDDPDDVHDALTVEGGGFLGSFMGDGLAFYVYIVNGELMNFAPGETVLQDGDVVELFGLLNTAMWDDAYCWFESDGRRVRSLSATAGESIALTLKGIEYVIWGDDEAAAVAGASIVPAELIGGGAALFGEPLAITDPGGAFSLSYDDEGVYFISAIRAAGPLGAALMSPWLAVTVTDETVAPPVNKTALNAGIAEAAALDAGDYTAASWERLQTALAAAQAAADDAGATQEQVDAAGNALRSAISGLAPRPQELAPYKEALEAALGWLRSHTAVPVYGDEWAVLALARAGVDDGDWYDNYLAALGGAVEASHGDGPGGGVGGDGGGVGGDGGGAGGPGGFARWTDYERVTLALTALGADASDFNGYDLTAPFKAYAAPGDRDSTNNAILNADIYALIALNSKPYDGDAAQYAGALSGAAKPGGGWGVGTSASADITAMAIQALAPYYNAGTGAGDGSGADEKLRVEVKAAVDGAVTWLGARAPGDAGELAQIIVALAAIGADAGDYVDALLAYFDEASGGFKQGAFVNAMATEQAAYALVAYDRYAGGKNSLYDMSDAGDWAVVIPVNKTALAEQIARAEALKSADYTSGTWAFMRTALTAAKAVYDNAGAGQADMDAAAGSLAAAVAALIKISGGDGGGGGARWTAYISVTDPNAKGNQVKTYFAGKYMEISQGETVYDLLVKTGLSLDVSGGPANGTYIISINGFGELSDGPESGWMYRVNGVFIETSCSLVQLKNGDRVEFLFTRDNGKDIGGGASTGSKSSGGTSAGAPAANMESGNAANGGGEAETAETLGDAGAPQGAAANIVKMPYAPPTDMSEDDYDLLTVYYIDGDGNMVEIKGTRYDPASGEMVFSTDVNAEFIISEWINPFNDVEKGWYYRDARFVYGEGLMAGTGGGAFSPESPLTRAMLVTILWRMAGEPLPPTADLAGEPLPPTADVVGSPDGGAFSVTNAPFEDVAAGEWYSGAINWAAARGLVVGYGDGTFGPDDEVTREQFALILYRYAGSPDLTDSDLSEYADAAEISDWALCAMGWAHSEGLINGRSQTELAPLGSITRAETAAILHRFLLKNG